MNIQLILNFLKEISAHNNREWFHAHKEAYHAMKTEFEAGVNQAIARIAEFDPSVAHITAKDACFRFYRDTRFSQDKSPYKNHLGAYISARGKKSLHGGYYLHIEPGRCLLAGGAYFLPTNILTACRNEIMARIDEWRNCVENKQFVKYFGRPAGGTWIDRPSDKGFGLQHLKTAPKGFPRDYEHMEYLKMKDYACWTVVPDDFFSGEQWKDEMARILQLMKPMIDFMNDVIDDYE